MEFRNGQSRGEFQCRGEGDYLQEMHHMLKLINVLLLLRQWRMQEKISGVLGYVQHRKVFVGPSPLDAREFSKIYKRIS